MPEKKITSRQEKILAVDDDNAIRFMLKRIISSIGYNVTTATDGADAVNKLKNDTFSVVITDILMPHMNGMDLLQHIRKNYTHINVIVVTGFSDKYSFNDIILAGATDFIIKPFEKVELTAKLQRVIRERRHIENLNNEIAAKKAEKDKLETITTAANDAILMMDTNGIISFWNEAATRIFGFTKVEALGQNLHSLIAPTRFHNAFQQGFKKFIKNGQGSVIDKTLELQGKRKDGSEFPAELSISSVKLNGVWNAVGLVRDITDRKIINAELHKAKNEALQASKAKTAFINTISHELRTPMNGILGMTSLLKSTELSATQNEYLDMAIVSSERLMNLIYQLLDFSVIDSQKKNLNSTSFEISQTIDNLPASLRKNALKKGITLSFHIDETTPKTIFGDPVVLSQVLNNLISNAVTHTDHGQILVEVIAKEKVDANNILLQFSVMDTGKGIPLDNQKEIFDSFTQVEDYLSRNNEGAGLGLAICSKLVELMDGEIWLESVPGKGSNFFFTATFEIRQE